MSRSLSTTVTPAEAGEIAAAFADAAIVQLLEGTYTVPGEIFIPTGSKLRGTSLGGTVLTFAGTFTTGAVVVGPSLSAAATDVEVSDLTVLPNPAAQCVALGVPAGQVASRLAVKRVKLGCGTQGAWLGNFEEALFEQVIGCGANVMSGNTFDFSATRSTFNRVRALGTGGPTGAGFWLNSVTDSHFLGCVSDSMSCGFGFQTQTPVARLKFDSCEALNFSLQGFYVGSQAPSTVAVEDLDFHGCRALSGLASAYGWVVGGVAGSILRRARIVGGSTSVPVAAQGLAYTPGFSPSANDVVVLDLAGAS